MSIDRYLLEIQDILNIIAFPITWYFPTKKERSLNGYESFFVYIFYVLPLF